ncbi:hypothetical protein [Reinekea sp. G2M2-21]|uniref:hypothetical protein n=1 Tax=Reinekea sp. G2M2-21 TaxID=2788942 RepID=UPI0018A939C0|nr:hypothetical protein [Reinekea sp. G2M2-21]
MKKLFNLFKRQKEAKSQSDKQLACKRFEELSAEYRSVLASGGIPKHLRSVLSVQLAKAIELEGLVPDDQSKEAEAAWVISLNTHLNVMKLTLEQVRNFQIDKKSNSLLSIRQSINQDNKDESKPSGKAKPAETVSDGWKTGPTSLSNSERKELLARLAEYHKRSDEHGDFDGKEYVDSEVDTLLRLLQEADQAEKAESEGKPESPEKKSRRDFLTQGAIVSVVSAMVLAPSTAHAGWFGEEAAAIIAALWQFASKLWKAMNEGTKAVNGMLNDIGNGLGILEGKLQAGFEASVEAGTMQNDKSIMALGSLGDKIVEQIVANERTRTAQAAQPSSGVCGDDILNAAQSSTKKLVDQQTESAGKAAVQEATMPAANDNEKVNRETKRNNYINKVAPSVTGDINNPNAWNHGALSYASAMAPGSTPKPERFQQDSETFVYFVSHGLPNDGIDELDQDYLKTGDSALPTMVYQKTARDSVAKSVLERHRLEELPDPSVYNATISHLRNNVETQKSALREIRAAQSQDGSDLDISVNQGRLALSEQILSMAQRKAAPIRTPDGGRENGLSYRKLEQFKVERWTGPEYHAYLNVTGPEPAPLLRDLLKQQGVSLELQQSILDELRHLSDLSATLLYETMDSNLVRKEEMAKARTQGRT